MGRCCKHCGSTEIDEDAARGDAICMGCGVVLEESIVVVENQFTELAGGSHALVGQFVSADRQNPMGNQDSREQTFYKGKKLIEEIASQLRITMHCIDTAFNFFKMCVCRGLTRGRIRSHVVASCLYMTCRLENTGHLLLDFSDITQVNVYDLGRTLSFLARALRINLPTTDPCLYLLRFAVMLNFGEKQKDIVTLATRLVQRMKRDWMATGRRPTGLCGAALLLAARANNFNRTVQDIVKVVHISEQVVRKRLDEFARTPSANLTVDEFSAVDLEHSEDPPAFREARLKAREEQIKREELKIELMTRDLQPMQAEVERELDKRMREKFKKTPFAVIVGGSLEDPELGEVANSLVRNQIIDTAFDEAEPTPGPSSSINWNAFGLTPETLGIGRVIETNSNVMVPQQPPAQLSSQESEEREDGELDLSGIDDNEIETYILTEKEAEVKEQFWMKVNSEHLKEMERKQQERKEQEERDRLDPKKKKKKPSRKREEINANDPLEAIEKVIQEKRLSNKVNYDILKEIERGTEGLQPSFMTKEEIGRTPSEIVAEVNRLVVGSNIESVDAMESPSMEFAVGRPEVTGLKLSRLEAARRRKGLRGRMIPIEEVKDQLLDDKMAILTSAKKEPDDITASSSMDVSGSTETKTTPGTGTELSRRKRIRGRVINMQEVKKQPLEGKEINEPEMVKDDIESTVDEVPIKMDQVPGIKVEIASSLSKSAALKRPRIKPKPSLAK
ncbi:unnamed protein product, partial [Mesorhabditis belari]|uniref:B-related factor 1 n=1 Tax=Mesorhabditis belari TaxID=2138241 RepID=A0AAF3F1P6_9BILA